MSAVARWTEQVVILTTEERKAWLKEMKALYGVSEAQVARDCIELGSELLAKHYAKLGIKHPRAGKTAAAKPARKSRVSQKGHAPGAVFVSPGDAPEDPAALRHSASVPV